MKKIILSIAFLLMARISFEQTITRIESVQSLFIEIYKDNLKLGSATGFIIQSRTRNYLVTNYHVVTNRKPTDQSWLDPNQPISPNRIVITHNAVKLGEYITKSESLFSPNGDTLWHRDKINNEMVDVIELPLTDTMGVKIYPVNYNNTPDSILITPTERVFIPGFPAGLKSYPSMPIWKSGLLASEPDLDQDNKPIVWVDDIAIGGMSGSPVYLIGNQFADKHGSQMMFMGQVTYFMGVFSYGVTIVYGALWKASYLKQIFIKLP